MLKIQQKRDNQFNNTRIYNKNNIIYNKNNTYNKNDNNTITHNISTIGVIKNIPTQNNNNNNNNDILNNQNIINTKQTGVIINVIKDTLYNNLLYPHHVEENFFSRVDRQSDSRHVDILCTHTHTHTHTQCDKNIQSNRRQTDTLCHCRHVNSRLFSRVDRSCDGRLFVDSNPPALSHDSVHRFIGHGEYASGM
eukprot:GHVR01142666.1.p1 GENE.GHVR01142666.1~~GHVR01142666.1.p1  ORF type:complete len:194 (+),score=82.21 GHVR01142666.1:142-723(+)